MPTTVTGALVEEAMKLHTGASWVELWEIRTSTADPTDAYLICAHPTAITFGGQTYEPFPIERSEETANLKGDIPELALTVSNIDRAIQTRIDAGEILGCIAVRRLINTSTIGTAANVVRIDYTVLSADCSDTAAVFRLGIANPVNRDFPGRRYQRNRCDHDYGGAACGYDTTRAGAIPDCDRTLLGANGCILHGDDEETAGLPRAHAKNYGGEPSLMRGPFA